MTTDERLAQDERLAEEALRDWLGGSATRSPLTAMNSSAWLVDDGAQRYVLKIAALTDEPGLRVAAWLEDHGLPTGAPVHITARSGRLVALLRFVDGRPLTTAVGDVVRIGETLGRAHALLEAAPAPEGLEHWPWTWLEPGAIDEPDLRVAATRAIERAQRLAPAVTHGILHADPAPEAFLTAGEEVALIDWGAACHGPFLYDVASALMYAGEGVVAAYARNSPLSSDELAAIPDFLAVRWAVQAWYFSSRIRRHDLTGLPSDAGNLEGLADARRGLLG